MMAELLTAAQMRAIEAAAIGGGAVTGLELMERAGRGVVEAVFAEWPEAKEAPQRAVVLCGPGNNGGDGFVIARLLRERGWQVAVWFLGSRDRQPPDAGAMHDRWLEAGGTVFAITAPFLPDSPRPSEPWHDGLEGGHAFVIDALFGIGLTRPIDNDSGLWRALGGHFVDARDDEDVEVHRIAVDVPSGLCADSGRVLSTFTRANFRTVFAADLTVAIGHFKIGHFIGEGPDFCGRVVRADLGALGATGHGRPGYRDPAGDAVLLVTRDKVAIRPQDHGWMGRGSLAKTGGHKYAHGHALILAGGPGRGGAARLAARGALRIGAGLVTLGCPPEALTENAARLDAIMLREVGDDEALDDLLRDRRINALGLGPGLGLDGRAESLVAAALRWHLSDGLPLIDATEAQVERWMRRHGHRCACVLDADALTILARRPELFAALHPGCVLTPHGGEFARLFPDLAERLAAPATEGPAWSKVDATREAARRAGCVVLYKGPDTVIADPEGRCAISSAHYDRAVPWLATAGSGDVLAGFIAGLLARGFAPMAAAETAAWLHVECALDFGPGLIAEDLPERLPAVLRRIGR